METLQSFVEVIEKEEKSNIKEDSTTFLSIIGKEYYETYISKILLYVLTTRKSLLRSLIKRYKNEKKLNWTIDYNAIKINKFRVEESMDNGKADIFIELNDGEEDITFTLENKIFASEQIHNSDENIYQTDTYATYVDNKYKGKNNIFIYLKPNYNYSVAHSDKFLNITYRELCNLIKESDNDIIINDFEKHIGGYLETMKITDVDKFYFEHYSDILKAQSTAEEKLINIKKELMGYLKENFDINGKKIKWQPFQSAKDFNDANDNDIVMQKVDNDSTFRVYIKYEWYPKESVSDTERYYFYSEVKFINSLQNIICQNAVKFYGKSESIVNEFIDTKMISNATMEKDRYVFENSSFSWDKESLFDDWIVELQKWTCETLTDYFNKMAGIVKEFNDFKINKANSNKE